MPSNRLGTAAIAASLLAAILAAGPSFAGPSGAEPRIATATESSPLPPPRPSSPGALIQVSAATPDPSEVGVGEVVVVDQELRSVIAEFARLHGLEPEIAGELRQAVRNERLPLDRQSFLARIQGLYGVSGVIEGNRLIVSGKSPVVTRLLPLNKVPFAKLEAQLKRAAVATNDKMLRVLPESDAVMVTAPATVVAQISGILEAMSTGGGGAGTKIIGYGIVRTERTP